MKKSSLSTAAAIGCLLLCFASCGKAPRPRTASEITADRMALPTLYLTASGREVVASGGQGVVIDQASGELAFAAYECLNPNCPKKGAGRGGRPYLFTWPDPTLYVKPDGTLGAKTIETMEQWEEIRKQYGLTPERACPACYASRDVASETEEQSRQYRDWVQPYVLPETRQRLKELDEEHRRRNKELELRRKRKV